MMKKITLSALLFSFGTFTAFSQQEKNGFLNNTLFLTAGYAVHTQYMDEYLYTGPGNTKASELNWQNKFTSIFTLGAEWKPIDKLTLGFMANFNVFKSTGKYKMDDYDWMDGINVPFTDHSIHTKGKFRYIDLDFFGKYNFYSFGDINNHGRINLYALLGFRYTDITSGAIGGIGYYDSGDTILHFDESHVVLEYRQKMFMPYFGFAVGYQYKRLEAILTFKNSILNVIKVRDNHVDRDLITDMKHDFVYQYTFDLNVGYWVTDRWKVFSFFRMLHTIHNKDNQAYFGNDRSSRKIYTGMSNISYAFGIGVTFGLDVGKIK